MKLNTLVESCQRFCDCKDSSSFTSNYRVLSLPDLQYQVFPKHISESINGDIMKLDTLREGNKKKSTVQEP